MPTDKHWDGNFAMGACPSISAISDHGYLDVLKICLADVDDASAELGRKQTIEPGTESAPRLLANTPQFAFWRYNVRSTIYFRLAPAAYFLQ